MVRPYNIRRINFNSSHFLNTQHIMALGFSEDEDVSMAFPATCIRFGRFEVQPIQNVELSHEQLRIVFRTSEQSSQDDSVSFEINPMEFVKTVYTFSETSTKILFRVCEKHLDCIKADVKGLFEAFNQSAGGKMPKVHCWIIIETDAFSASDQKQFEEIVSHLIGCDKITSDEIDKMIASITKTSEKPAAAKENKSATTAAANGSGGAAATAAAASKPTCIIEYPLNAKGAFSVTVQSYEYLATGEFLDDAIIEFYSEYLRLEMLTTEQRARTHIFSVFFYSVLTARSSRGVFSTPGLSTAQRRHERVAKWTKDVDIFEKDFLIVPVNSRNHWFLAVVCYPSLESPVYMDTDEPVPVKKRRSASKADDRRPIKQPCILIFDSLGGEKGNVVNTLREYLSCEYEVKMKKRRIFDDVNMPGHSVNSPGQPNLCDCGLFLLQNIEQFFKDPIKSFELPIAGLKNWYNLDVAMRKRRDIAELVQRLIPAHGTGFSIDDLPQIELPE